MYGIKIPKPNNNTLQTDTHNYSMGFSGGSEGKESACNARDLVLIPVLGRFPGKGNGTHSNIFAWRILMDRGAWQATVCRFTE